jgi:hypothetical protein
MQIENLEKAAKAHKYLEMLLILKGEVAQGDLLKTLSKIQLIAKRSETGNTSLHGVSEKIQILFVDAIEDEITRIEEGVLEL